jgi:hypothetical protein
MPWLSTTLKSEGAAKNQSVHRRCVANKRISLLALGLALLRRKDHDGH